MKPLFLPFLFVTTLSAAPSLESLKLLPGFTVEVWAEVENPRGLAMAENTVFAGTFTDGRVWAIPFDKKMKSGRAWPIAQGLNIPLGVAYDKGALYVSSVSRILRLDNIGFALQNKETLNCLGKTCQTQRLDGTKCTEKKSANESANNTCSLKHTVILDGLPATSHHGGRYLGMDPDGNVYVAVGAPCNLCDPGNNAGKIIRIKPDGTNQETVARGVRNSVGLAWHPITRELWFTDNGRDNLADDLPPDELNRLPKGEFGRNFGYPYCYGAGVRDKDMPGDINCDSTIPVAQALGAHVAPLGLRFYNREQFPVAYRGQIFVAEHGSWNRSSKSGYRVSLIKLDEAGKRVVDYKPFIEGWKVGEKNWGRPVDLLVLPDGSLLISDDYANVIYRVSWVQTAITSNQNLAH